MRALQIMTPERIRLHRLYRAAIKNAKKKEALKRKAEKAVKIAYKRAERYKALLYPDGINYESTDNWMLRSPALLNRAALNVSGACETVPA
jgi:hypothetical protein